FTLLACNFHRLGCQHRIRMDRNQREMMKFQPDLRWITVQNLLNYWMECPATRTLIVPKLNQCYRGVFRATEVPATLNLNVSRSGRSSVCGFVRLAAEVHGRAGSDG